MHDKYDYERLQMVSLAACAACAVYNAAPVHAQCSAFPAECSLRIRADCSLSFQGAPPPCQPAERAPCCRLTASLPLSPSTTAQALHDTYVRRLMAYGMAGLRWAGGWSWASW